MIFNDVHKPIIDRDTWKQVQKLIAKTKRRAPKKENGEKNMFCGLLYCADCGSPLWFNINQLNKSILKTTNSVYTIKLLGTNRKDGE